MDSFAPVIYFIVIATTIGIAAALMFRFRYAITDLELKITGLWRNENNTMRILIYCIESRFQGEVVWIRDINQPILGSGVIKDLRLKYFSWGEGIYVDPISKAEFKVKLKLRDAGNLSLMLFDKSGKKAAKTEQWKQVHQMNYGL